MYDFLNVAKSLEIKEISKDVEFEQTYSENNKECDTMMNDNGFEAETIENSNTVAEDLGQADAKLKSYSKNESGQYPCNKCDKQFANYKNLYRHIKSAHEGLRFSCNDCKY